jgi:hypothetical protein
MEPLLSLFSFFFGMSFSSERVTEEETGWKTEKADGEFSFISA